MTYHRPGDRDESRPAGRPARRLLTACCRYDRMLSMTAATEHPQPVHLAVYDGLADWEVGHAHRPRERPSWQRTPGPLPDRHRGRRPTDHHHGRHAHRAGHDDRRAGCRRTARCWSCPARRPGSRAGTAFVELSGELLAAGTPVAAICGATVGLAAAGLLDDRRHTSNATEALAARSTAAATSTSTSRRSPTAGSSPPAAPHPSSSPAPRRTARPVRAPGPGTRGTSCSGSTTRPATSS